mgnify:CR=1 FL=1
MTERKILEKINHPSKAQVEAWQNDTVLDWAQESMDLRPSVYDIGDSKNLTYRYNYDHIAQVELRLLQAGIRLAGVLNEIYD